MLTQVGKYQIVEKIGVGGFGTVYKGRDPFIKRNVAIKTCQSEEEEIKKRFFREAEFAGNLHHRNVTTIYDFGVTDDGTPYIVQEFLTGDDLDKAIKKKEPLTLARKLQILIDVCEGLGYAHAAGIINRDIKPANIRILEDGTVKIKDFDGLMSRWMIPAAWAYPRPSQTSTRISSLRLRGSGSRFRASLSRSSPVRNSWTM